MKKIGSLLRKEVTILGSNGFFGRVISLLLKQSSFVNILNLFDHDTIEIGDDLKLIKTKCIIRCHSGKESIGDALKQADVIIVSDDASKESSSFFDSQGQFLQKAPKIVDYASKIAACNSAAIVIVATSPVNFALPLMNAVLDKLGKLDSRKVLGMTNVDIIRANSVYASHLRINPKSVWLPVVGGSSQETRVPLFSKARPSLPLDGRMLQKLTSEIKTFDLQVYGAKRENELLNRAYATARLVSAVMAGLDRRKGVIETVMSQQDVVKGTSFFSLPVLLGEGGIQKRIPLPHVSDYEQNLLSHSVKSLASDVSKALEHMKNNVNTEELNINSRVNKLNDLEIISRLKKVKNIEKYDHNSQVIKENCPKRSKNVFSKNADLELKTDNKIESKFSVPIANKYFLATEEMPGKTFSISQAKTTPAIDLNQNETSTIFPVDKDSNKLRDQETKESVACKCEGVKQSFICSDVVLNEETLKNVNVEERLCIAYSKETLLKPNSNPPRDCSKDFSPHAIAAKVFTKNAVEIVPNGSKGNNAEKTSFENSVNTSKIVENLNANEKLSRNKEKRKMHPKVEREKRTHLPENTVKTGRIPAPLPDTKEKVLNLKSINVKGYSKKLLYCSNGVNENILGWPGEYDVFEDPSNDNNVNPFSMPNNKENVFSDDSTKTYKCSADNSNEEVQHPSANGISPVLEEHCGELKEENTNDLPQSSGTHKIPKNIGKDEDELNINTGSQDPIKKDEENKKIPQLLSKCDPGNCQNDLNDQTPMMHVNLSQKSVLQGDSDRLKKSIDENDIKV